tara:strand:- start:6616 stop:7650 length:1035 start_codon:yes stop_codon:yes gene_type:complete
MSQISDRILVQEHLAHERLASRENDEVKLADYKLKVAELLRQKNAVLVAHYYTDPVIQSLAEETGGFVSDSLEMARFGRDHKADTLVVAGVKFMGETAKILSPEKTVLMPTLEATCSLDVGCPIEEFSAFCDQHPDHTVVVYANTSAAVKARADWVVTSSIALDIVRYLDKQGKKILWAPDQHLGNYIQSQTGAEMLMWQGSCIVHEEFKGQGLVDLQKVYPDAAILVHPESPQSMIELADAVGSTTQLIKASQDLPNETFIVATDNGIFYKMKQLSPEKVFIEAPTAGSGATCRSCAHCPWMAMNDLESLYQTLLTGSNEVEVNEVLRQKALIPLNRMLGFKI